MKVGDRVRINCPEGTVHGKEATIVDIRMCRLQLLDGSFIGPVRSYFVDVDGLGTIHPTRPREIAFQRHNLIPITKPKEETGTWEETFKGTDFNIRREHETI